VEASGHEQDAKSKGPGARTTSWPWAR